MSIQPLLSLQQAAGAAFIGRLANNSLTTLSGPSGSGKTQLLRAIADLDPHKWLLQLNNKPHTDYPPHIWRQQLQYLPAEPVWWTDTAAEVIHPDIQPLAEALGLSPKLLQHPVQQLSTGERQRFALLRALSVEPQILLLDEPTAALDENSAELVEALLQTWVNDRARAIIWVSHDRQQRQRLATQEWHIANGELRCP